MQPEPPICQSTSSPSPLVSVVITTYNQARFLSEAIESVLRQSVVPDDIIVVDDGSKDDPVAVVSRYPQIQMIRQHNQGSPAARNTGWRAARGSYVVFLDADDRLLPEAIRSNLELFAKNPQAAFVYGDYYFIDATGEQRSLPPPRLAGEDAYEVLLKGNRIVCQATVMYRRDRLDEANGFDQRAAGCEDYDLYLRLARQYPAASGPVRIAEYRLHGNNTSRNIPLMLMTVLGVLRRQSRYVADNPQWKGALAFGLRGCKSYYVREQIEQTLATAKALGLRRTPVCATFRVFLLAPGVFLGTFCGRSLKALLSRLSGRRDFFGARDVR